MHEERLIRLEESQAFAERTIDALDAEVRTLGEKVDEMRRTIARLEARIESLMEHEPDADA